MKLVTLNKMDTLWTRPHYLFDCIELVLQDSFFTLTNWRYFKGGTYYSWKNSNYALKLFYCNFMQKNIFCKRILTFKKNQSLSLNVNMLLAIALTLCFLQKKLVEDTFKFDYIKWMLPWRYPVSCKCITV